MKLITCTHCKGTGQVDVALMSFGERMRMAREAKGFTIRDVEKLLDGAVSNATVTQIETGRNKDPGFSRVLKLCQLYEIDPKEFL